MRKSLHSFFSILVALLLAACGGPETTPAGGESPATDAGQPAPAATAEEPSVSEKIGAVRNLLSASAARGVNELETDSTQPAIEVPDQLDGLRSALKAAGKSDLLGQLSASLDTAGKELAGQALPVLEDTIADFGIGDVDRILEGGPTAATDLIRGKARDTLVQRLTPLAEQALRLAGAEAVVDQIEAALGAAGSGDTGAVLGGIKQMTGVEIPSDLDLPAYLAAETTDGLFAAMAKGEQAIRENPELLGDITNGILGKSAN
jgi:hypothetical protein